MLNYQIGRYSIVVVVIGLLVAIGQHAFVASAVTDSAEYRITFRSNWNNTAHPHTQLPSSAHWSSLVGATHSDSVSFWEAGALASPGMEAVAELGANGTFQSEVNNAIATDTADQWIQRGFSPFSAPESSATVTLTVAADYPLLTLATMIAPSPDWFAGVNSLSLQDASGNWKPSFTLDLYPYDAGTEDGTTYSLSNPATDPAEAIRSIRGEAPFSDAPIATLTVTLLSPLPDFDHVIYLPMIVR